MDDVLVTVGRGWNGAGSFVCDYCGVAADDHTLRLAQQALRCPESPDQDGLHEFDEVGVAR